VNYAIGALSKEVTSEWPVKPGTTAITSYKPTYGANACENLPRPCHQAGGELEQSHNAVNDRIGLEQSFCSVLPA